jgi:hypothetical protein
MKKSVILLGALLTLASGWGQDFLDLPFADPCPPRPWTVTLKIVDEIGVPVTNAECTVSFTLPTKPEEEYRSGTKSGFTDSNGVFMTANVDCTSRLGFRIKKDGYYPTRERYEFDRQQLQERKIRVPEQTLVLKKIRNPIPMFARDVHENPPVTNKPIGFDLAAGNWVAPHGTGKVSDIIFTKYYETKSQTEYRYIITVSFPNSGDGIQESSRSISLFEGSELRSPHEAPIDGYSTNLTKEASSGFGKPSVFDFDAKRNYFFRVRTVLDEKGNVKSAHYGKIYGDFMTFTYYLNPQPNSRNLEFDTTRNLMKDVGRGGHVSRP